MQSKSSFRLYLSLISRLTAAFLSLLNFVFYAFNCFKVQYYERDVGAVISTFRGYDVLSKNIPFFSKYVPFLALLGLIVSGLTVIVFLLQIYAFKDDHIPNIIMLGSIIIIYEFLLDAFTFTGYVIFILSIVNLLQYFFLMRERKERDWWVLGGMAVLILSLLPSALVSSSLFR